ncbi:hypothetical protein [Mycetocola spongiae]|uniref:hypothetical protein n=1 Tax=Mycetocola spongiae TaxID=2859226 RepID=UPI001CF17A79|nr:hypothetical protein [Mycetocola spongiae]UCR87973.1 hypothetical protein KXZ72_08100 [Mycetocola spongiae]
MMKIAKSRLSTLAVVVALSGLALTGCSAGNTETASSTGSSSAAKPSKAPAEKSVAEACKIVNTQMVTASQEMQQSVGAFASNPMAEGAATTASDAMKKLVTDFDASLEEGSNAEVTAAAAPLRDMFESMGDLLQQISVDPASVDVTALNEIMSSGQAAGEKFSALCGG